MADPDGAVEVRGTVAVGATVARKRSGRAASRRSSGPGRTWPQTIDTLMDRVSPANTARRLRERLREEAARPEVRLAAVAVGLAVAGILVLRIWGRRKK